MNRRVFGQNVRWERRSREWSQTQLAQAAGITPTHLGIVERGGGNPTIDTMAAIAGALGVPLTKLLEVQLRSSDLTPTPKR